jgi:hypothetical protein
MHWNSKTKNVHERWTGFRPPPKNSYSYNNNNTNNNNNNDENEIVTDLQNDATSQDV